LQYFYPMKERTKQREHVDKRQRQTLKRKWRSTTGGHKGKPAILLESLLAAGTHAEKVAVPRNLWSSPTGEFPAKKPGKQKGNWWGGGGGGGWGGGGGGGAGGWVVEEKRRRSVNPPGGRVWGGMGWNIHISAKTRKPQRVKRARGIWLMWGVLVFPSGARGGGMNLTTQVSGLSNLFGRKVHGKKQEFRARKSQNKGKFILPTPQSQK